MNYYLIPSNIFAQSKVGHTGYASGGFGHKSLHYK